MAVSSTPRRSSAIVLLSFGTLVAALLWAAFAQVDQVSRATGQIIPQGRVQVVQSADGGTIKTLTVQEGDRVSRIAWTDPDRIGRASSQSWL